MDGVGTLTLHLHRLLPSKVWRITVRLYGSAPRQEGFAYTPVIIPSIFCHRHLFIQMLRSNEHYCIAPVLSLQQIRRPGYAITSQSSVIKVTVETKPLFVQSLPPQILAAVAFFLTD